MSKPSIPQGTRDFPAEVIRKRNYIFFTIRSVFELFGFEPLETPSMENLETLMGKYGDEGDKLIFKILNNGLDNPAKLEQAQAGFQDILAGKNNKNITERALRYDLTIPFARYVAMNHGKLNFPFKRYQIQPVWRADRPQRGRYREFYQCDADIVGSLSLVNEAELASLYSMVFEQLRVPVSIQVNNRKILAALANKCGGAHLMTPITVAIDKLDKIGIDKVKEELAERGLSAQSIETVDRYLSITGSTEEKITQAEAILGDDPEGIEGIAELRYIHSFLPGKLETDLTLARGLNYYTGTIFEVKALGVQMGSIGGGGRYDDLTGLFGVPNVPGVGISFGVDRIYDVMEELKLMPEETGLSTKILFFNLGEGESRMALQLMKELRQKGISCELYHENSKFDKQFKYAEKKNIPFIGILGEQELSTGTIMVKELSSGLQDKLAFSDLIPYFLNQKK
jgi:histidyl-tRNA synthetase